MKIDIDMSHKSMGAAAAAGAATALVLAMFTPAVILLGLELAAIGGVYAYCAYAGGKEKKAAEGAAEDGKGECNG